LIWPVFNITKRGLQNSLKRAELVAGAAKKRK